MVIISLIIVFTFVPQKNLSINSNDKNLFIFSTHILGQLQWDKSYSSSHCLDILANHSSPLSIGNILDVSEHVISANLQLWNWGHFTSEFSITLPIHKKCYFIFIQIQIIWSLQNLALSIITILLWHVQMIVRNGLRWSLGGEVNPGPIDLQIRQVISRARSQMEGIWWQQVSDGEVWTLSDGHQQPVWSLWCGTHILTSIKDIWPLNRCYLPNQV